MIQSVGSSVVGLTDLLLPLMQIPDPIVVDPTERASYIFSGPQFFIALIAGLVLAFAFQLLLTNLSVATGVSALDFKPSSSSKNSSSQHDQSNGGIGSTVRKISTAMGLWTLITVTIAIFFACLLAVNLAAIPEEDPIMGTIIALVIWGAFFTIMVWLSSAKVGSLFGSVVDTATSSFQRLFGAATAAIGAKAANQQIIDTAEAAASTVRRELTAAIDPQGVREQLEDYLQTLRPAEINAQDIRQEFEQLLAENPEIASADPATLRGAVDRQTLIDLVSSRTDLSQREVRRIAQQLDTAWTRSVSRAKGSDSIQDLVNYIKTAEPRRLLSEELGQRLDALIDEMRIRRESQSGSAQQSLMHLLNGLAGVAMGRVDLSDLDVQTITKRLKHAGSQVSSQANQLVSSDSEEYSVIRADVENYLLNTYSWHMRPGQVEQDFRDVLYDPEADPRVVRHQLDNISRSDFVSLLQSRGVFTQERIQSLADQLERIRREVRIVAYEAEARAIALELRRRVETFLYNTPKAELTNHDYSYRAFKSLLETPDTEYSVLVKRLEVYDRDLLRSILVQRDDISPGEAEVLLDPLENARNDVLSEAKSIDQKAQERAQEIQQRLESYLRNTGREELNPDDIEREIQMLLNDPQMGFAALRNRLSHVDRNTFVKLLSQRQDLSEADVNRVINQVESNWHKALRAPKSLSLKAQEQYENATTTIADYLRSTGKDELNPEGIKRDLSRLTSDPQAGAIALRDRLAQMDRDTLVKLLSQRQDMTEDEVNQTIDSIEESIRSIVRAPRRWATRTQAKVQDFQTALEDYLRNTDKAELSPAGIKRDLRLLFNDPRLGMERLSDRVYHMDRSTIVALLSQRDDISEAEANRIVDQVVEVRNQVVEQLRSVQAQVQSVIDGILARIRDYLNSLERPELNYYGIKQDVKLLFDQPDIGFEALRERLSAVDRGTLVAIMSSRDDVSEADAQRIIGQVEDARDSVLQQAERLQTAVQHRMDEMKYQARKQLDETRKVAASAAWWLFATSVVSAFAAGIAGSLAAS